MSFNEQVLVLCLKNNEKEKIIFLWAKKRSRTWLILLASFTEEKTGGISKSTSGPGRRPANPGLRVLWASCRTMSTLRALGWRGQGEAAKCDKFILLRLDPDLTSEMSTTKQHGHQKAYKYNVPKSRPMLRKIPSQNLYKYLETSNSLSNNSGQAIMWKLW